MRLVPLALFLALFSTQALACLRYIASAPWDDNLPFVGNITDNGVVTCWISMTYADHDRWQRGIPPVQGVIEPPRAWEFREWMFECRPGFKATSGIGHRTVKYWAHKQQFAWVVHSVEDILGERFLLWKDMFCDPEPAMGLS